MARPGTKNLRPTPKLSVRPATLKDISALVRQRREMWVDIGLRDGSLHDKADKAYRRWAKGRMKTGRLTGWLVEDAKGSIAGGGCLWLQPTQPHPRRTHELQPYLLSMYTEPKFRRLGVASMVVSQAIAWSRKHGYPRLTLHASDMGLRVYEKLGFKRTREMRLDLVKAPRASATRRKKTIARS